MKKSVTKKIMACFAMFFCLLISGCGDSRKDQIIAVYDYSSSTEKEYGAEDKTADDLVNQLCDYFLDGESETYCKASFDFSDQEYTAKLPAEISAQVEKLEAEGK